MDITQDDVNKKIIKLVEDNTTLPDRFIDGPTLGAFLSRAFGKPVKTLLGATLAAYVTANLAESVEIYCHEANATVLLFVLAGQHPGSGWVKYTRSRGVLPQKAKLYGEEGGALKGEGSLAGNIAADLTVPGATKSHGQGREHPLSGLGRLSASDKARIMIPLDIVEKLLGYSS